jgi:putative nucleotidyltransferase with HDIG domain
MKAQSNPSEDSSPIAYDGRKRPMRDLLLPFVPEMFTPLRSEWAANTTLGKEESAGIPDQAACTALWDKYDMPPHIRAHSAQVAFIVACLGSRLQAVGANINLQLLLAGALLHDIAKAYTIKFGGSHAQLGASWMRREAGYYHVTQIVLHHVHWPWALDVYNESMLPALLVVYADKRVKHDRLVTIEERFADLMCRYGHTELSRMYINASKEQGLELEQVLSERLGVNLNEYTFNCRRLV